VALQFEEGRAPRIEFVGFHLGPAAAFELPGLIGCDLLARPVLPFAATIPGPRGIRIGCLWISVSLWCHLTEKCGVTKHYKNKLAR
jgi:hypothetical protein